MINVLDHGEVELINHTGGDESVLRAMLVSTGKDTEDLTTEVPLMGREGDYVTEEVKRNRGRINYLMRKKHGTPFEHNMFTFRIKAPIFVIREWHRHRIGWSYNEQSGRYMELGPHWYIPAIGDTRVRVGKPGHYAYQQANGELDHIFRATLEEACSIGYRNYKNALSMGVAPEQARLFLHVNHYSAFYATCNARSLMNFLVLRNDEQAQWEIRQYAQILEKLFGECMPVTYRSFVANGRLAP